MKKVVIVGAGISGMTAGIYLQKAGFETEIYERNSVPGGQCMGWKREGYTIDNCIDWLTGTKKDTELYKIWENVGALGDNIGVVKPNKWFSETIGNKTVTFWRDPERTRKEMLELSPEDADEINRLIDSVKAAKDMGMPTAKPMDMMSVFEMMKFGMSMKDMMKILKIYGKDDLRGLAARFKSPIIGAALMDFLGGDYSATAMISSYATIISGNGDIPKGGSLAMSLRMAEKYKSLGGKLFTNSDVEKVMVDGKLATGIKLADGKEIKADYVVLACDCSFTFSKLLDKKYVPKALQEEYEKRETYPVSSLFHVAFAVDGTYKELEGMNLFECEPMTVAKSEIGLLLSIDYSYEHSFAPEGKSVLQCRIGQSEEDYNYWKNLYDTDREKYKAEKRAAAEKVMAGFIKHYPFLEGKIRIIDTWTPVTYNRYCNSYKGSFMSFIMTKGGKNNIVPGVIKGIDNAFIASEWLMSPGGTPVALTMGKFAAQRIMKKEKVNINV